MADRFGFPPAKLRGGKGRKHDIDGVLPVASGLHERGSGGIWRANIPRAAARWWLKRRRRFFGACAVIALLLASVLSYLAIFRPDHEFWRKRIVLQAMRVPNLPPLYPEYRREEALLPQNLDTHPFSGGKKYLWVATHTQCKESQETVYFDTGS